MTTHQPLAARMRPTSLDDIVGQDKLLIPGSILRTIASSTDPISVLLWGPPGTGKTSIAQAIAVSTSRIFVELSATSAGVKDVRTILDNAKKNQALDKATLLFLDEIHRFSKAQQDILLPAVESGLISLIGATTENPSFSVISALNSRSALLILDPITSEDIVGLLRRALDQDEILKATGLTADDDALHVIAELSSGDARQALTRFETAIQMAQAMNKTGVDAEIIEQLAGRAIQRYDPHGDQHYDIISAFIKSMRGSDPQAALHWLARMIEGGEDPRYIARRLIVHASEDVGMADPTVLPLAIAAAQAVQFVGLPEAAINLAHATVAVATAPKSPWMARAIGLATEDVRNGITSEVPMPLRDSHYPGAKSLGHGAGYKFPHNFPNNIVEQQYMPDAAIGRRYYEPTRNGFEKTIAARMEAIQKIVTPEQFPSASGAESSASE